ncbi:MAG: hypothetical protein Q8L07_14590 [Sediminibacterium sp.]|nr:hypothetical protein [Sediminibacterium sp.]
MKKYEHLGKSLSREEQKSIGGGFTQVANTICVCNSPEETFPVCGTTCNDVYGQCAAYCNAWAQGVKSYGTCTFAGACW